MTTEENKQLGMMIADFDESFDEKVGCTIYILLRKLKTMTFTPKNKIENDLTYTPRNVTMKVVGGVGDGFSIIVNTGGTVSDLRPLINEGVLKAYPNHDLSEGPYEYLTYLGDRLSGRGERLSGRLRKYNFQDNDTIQIKW